MKRSCEFLLCLFDSLVSIFNCSDWLLRSYSKRYLNEIRSKVCEFSECFVGAENLYRKGKRENLTLYKYYVFLLAFWYEAQVRF